MKVYVRTVENGERIPMLKVQEKCKAVQDKILQSGFQYIVTESLLGSLNALGQRIEERVYIIEDVYNDTYL